MKTSVNEVGILESRSSLLQVVISSVIQFDKSFHPMGKNKVISFAHSWISMKLKNEVMSWNKYTPPHPKVTYYTYPASKDNFSWMRNCQVGPLYAKKILSSKIRLFGLHNIARCPWQPIERRSWIRSMPPSFTCFIWMQTWAHPRHVAHSFVDLSLFR